MSAKDAAQKWNVSQRRVMILCSEGRILGAQLVGNSWVIPKNAKKPADARIKTAKIKTGEVKPFLKWAGGKGQLLAEIGKHYPFAEKNILKNMQNPLLAAARFFLIF